MNQPDWNRSIPQPAPLRRAYSSSVGSLPSPVQEDSANRALAGRWREAILAERALGWVLWSALAVVLVIVSR